MIYGSMSVFYQEATNKLFIVHSSLAGRVVFLEDDEGEYTCKKRFFKENIKYIGEL